MAPCDQDRNQLDPFASGYVQSLARPGGRVTGVFLRQTELAEKQTELLVQAVPGMARLGVLWDAISMDQFDAAERRAKTFARWIRNMAKFTFGRLSSIADQ
jgi:hypothetical protein